MKKAITLLRATAEDRNANVSSLARTAGLPRATALRMIQTLEQEGFLLRIPGEGPRLAGTGNGGHATSEDDRASRSCASGRLDDHEYGVGPFGLVFVQYAARPRDNSTEPTARKIVRGIAV